MITKYKRNKAAGVAIALLVLAGCGSSDADTSSDPATTEAESEISTTEADEPATTTASTDGDPGSPSSTTTDSGGSGDEPADFEGDFPPPEGSTLKRDGFAIGNDGARKAEFNLSGGGDQADAVNAYKTTLEGADFTISREQPGRAYIAEKGDLNLQITARKDLYEDGLVILSVIYQKATT